MPQTTIEEVRQFLEALEDVEANDTLEFVAIDADAEELDDAEVRQIPIHSVNRSDDAVILNFSDPNVDPHDWESSVEYLRITTNDRLLQEPLAQIERFNNGVSGVGQLVTVDETADPLRCEWRRY